MSEMGIKCFSTGERALHSCLAKALGALSGLVRRTLCKLRLHLSGLVKNYGTKKPSLRMALCDP